MHCNFKSKSAVCALKISNAYTLFNLICNKINNCTHKYAKTRGTSGSMVAIMAVRSDQIALTCQF